ncbi:MAG: Flp family type IVb pilin [Nitrospiraceae bacterium]|nr:MAG: Flp family type IVb pilin [Nitrospiraceae bacterium]
MKLLKKTSRKLMSVLRNERGQGLVEYALLLILIALVVFAMLQGTGRNINNAFSRINSAVGTQSGGGSSGG